MLKRKTKQAFPKKQRKISIKGLKRKENGFICGGVISQTQMLKDMKKYGVWANAMSYVMPDKQFKVYAKLYKAGKNKEAHEIFTKYAVSQI